MRSGQRRQTRAISTPVVNFYEEDKFAFSFMIILIFLDIIPDISSIFHLHSTVFKVITILTFMTASEKGSERYSTVQFAGELRSACIYTVSWG
jgi:hypothetical protein